MAAGGGKLGRQEEEEGEDAGRGDGTTQVLEIIDLVRVDIMWCDQWLRLGWWAFVNAWNSKPSSSLEPWMHKSRSPAAQHG